MFLLHPDRPLIDLAKVEGEDVVEMEEEDHCSTAPKVRVSAAQRASTARRLQQSFEDSPIVSGKVRKNIIYSDEEYESDKENEISQKSLKINQVRFVEVTIIKLFCLAPNPDGARLSLTILKVVSLPICLPSNVK